MKLKLGDDNECDEEDSGEGEDTRRNLQINCNKQSKQICKDDPTVREAMNTCIKDTKQPCKDSGGTNCKNKEAKKQRGPQKKWWQQDSTVSSVDVVTTDKSQVTDGDDTTDECAQKKGHDASVQENSRGADAMP